MFQATKAADLRSQYGRFYTSPTVSELLVGAMEVQRPSSVIDLGAGDGDLAVAARRRWDNASIITVDINEKDVLKHAHHLSAGGRVHRHIQADALNVELPKILKQEHGDFDAAVCNPPYLRSRWRREYIDMLQEANLRIEDQTYTELGTEVIFLAQNLRLTAHGGSVGVIVPDGIATGERQRPLRKSLVENNRLHCVITLPNGAFSHTDARAHILVLKKGRGHVGAVRLQLASRDGSLSEPLFVSSESACDRLDYNYHLQRAMAGAQAGAQLGGLNPEIRRGRLSSTEARNAPFPVFHTNNFPSDHRTSCFVAPPEMCVTPEWHAEQNLVIASPGDILIARVDRNLERKICLLTSGHLALSDCVFRIRVKPRLALPVYKSLSSQRGRTWLAAAARGVGAKYLTAATLLEFPFSLFG